MADFAHLNLGEMIKHLEEELEKIKDDITYLPETALHGILKDLEEGKNIKMLEKINSIVINDIKKLLDREVEKRVFEDGIQDSSDLPDGVLDLYS